MCHNFLIPTIRWASSPDIVTLFSGPLTLVPLAFSIKPSLEGQILIGQEKVYFFDETRKKKKKVKRRKDFLFHHLWSVS